MESAQGRNAEIATLLRRAQDRRHPGAQWKAAYDFGVSAGLWSRYLNGRCPVPGWRLAKIAEKWDAPELLLATEVGETLARMQARASQERRAA